MEDDVPLPPFFDDEDPSIKFEFQNIQEKHQKCLKIPATLQDNFSKDSKPSEVGRFSLYGLHGQLLVQYTDDSGSDIECVLDILHAKLNLLKPEGDESDYGFSVTRNGSTYTFYTTDKQIADNWLDALKKVCVLSTFHEDYKAIKMIGRGSFAKVYLVESKVTKKSYAVKAFTKEAMTVTNKANAKPALLNEIELLRTLDHENIIKLFEIYETEKSLYLVLELIQGKSLYDFLKKTNFREEVSATKLVNMFRCILDALAYMASKGIMHRDLKPDNILLDKGEKVKIVDFGLATFINVPHYIFKKCGTPGYIAPEVFKYDEKDPSTMYDDRCDVFSAGCLFYHMLFGVQLFPGNTAVDILKQNKLFGPDYSVLASIKEEYENPEGKISKDGIDLLLKLLEYEKEKRIYAAEALYHPYFTPIPMGMQRVAGSKEFILDSLSKITQNEAFSPSSPLKLSISPQELKSPLTPLRLDPLDSSSPLLPNKDRFVDQGSLYLDLGKPEINGRVDTMTCGSTNNSILLKPETTNIAPLPSVFNKNVSRSNSNSSGKNFKGTATSGNTSFLKAAIFRTMQKNNSEGLKDDECVKVKLDELKANRTYSESNSPFKENEPSEPRNLSESPVLRRTEDGDGEENDDDKKVELQLNFEPLSNANSEKRFGKIGAPSKLRKFQPFASSNLVIPKTDTENDG